MKHNYLTLHQKMDLYVILQAQEALERVSAWEWWDGKTRGFLKAFRTRFDNAWPEMTKRLPEGTIKKMSSFVDGYGVKFTPKVRDPVKDVYEIRRTDLEDLLEMEIEAYCFDCKKTGSDIKACMIRKHQMRLMHIRKNQQYETCEYAPKRRDE